ncbi:MAG: hypothetical protein ACPHTD_14585 [Gammaproteobacteria bacterium]|jgi:hypothetical protein
MRTAAYVAIAVILSWTGLAIAQLWFQPVSSALFLKLTITAGLTLAASVVAGLIYREYGAEKSLRDQKYID